MRFDQDRHHRRSIRLRGYDYAQCGAYFVTICTQGRLCLFGDIAGGLMRLNDAGRMVETVWCQIPDHYPGVATDVFVIMPNHIHGIIVIGPPDGDAHADGRTAVGTNTGATTRVAPTGGGMDATERTLEKPVGAGLVPARALTRAHAVAHAIRGGDVPSPGSPTLGDIVGAFKSITTVAYARGVRRSWWPPFAGRLWQRNYYEHIVRDDESLYRIRRYVADNPARWAEDPENPVGAGLVPARFTTRTTDIRAITRATTRVAPTCDDEGDA